MVFLSVSLLLIQADMYIRVRTVYSTDIIIITCVCIP